MQAPRRRRAVQVGVLVAVLGMAMGVLDGSLAKTRRSSETSPAATQQASDLPGVGAHDHGDGQLHYHVAPDGESAVSRAAALRGPRLKKAARGLVYKGLRRTHRKRCGSDGYAFETSRRAKACTHGPDEAPAGVDVRTIPTTTALEATTAQSAADGSDAALPCYGDGVTGPRVQAIYAHASDVPDRFAEIVAFIPQWAARVDWVYSQSAAETSGARHVRFVTNSDCTLAVANVTLSPSGDDSLDDTIRELSAQGFTRTDRKYLVWADAGRYCGIGEIKADDRADAGNANNFGPSFARVDAACWGMGDSVEAHELMHTMGGAQLSSPNSTGGWHCVDENDRMCLAETTNVALSFPCPAVHESLFDCGHDDYYSTAPAAGSYLATHWNAADSSFLSAAMPEGCSSPSSANQSEGKERRKHRKHRRARANDASAPCVPQTAFA